MNAPAAHLQPETDVRQRTDREYLGTLDRGARPDPRAAFEEDTWSDEEDPVVQRHVLADRCAAAAIELDLLLRRKRAHRFGLASQPLEEPVVEPAGLRIREKLAGRVTPSVETPASTASRERAGSAAWPRTSDSTSSRGDEAPAAIVERSTP